MISDYKKIYGFLCFIIGIALVFYGLSDYLNGPKDDGTSILNCVYGHGKNPIEKAEKHFYVFSCGDYLLDSPLYEQLSDNPSL